MANILANTDNWTQDSASIVSSDWIVRIEGANSSTINGHLTSVFGTVHSGDTLVTTVTYNITDPSVGNLWFMVTQGGDVIFTYKIADFENTISNSGSFPVSLTLDNNYQVEIGTSNVINYFNDNPTYSSDGTFTLLLPAPPPTPPTAASRAGNYVYELDKGWSFDGNYIPHFVELNWYFGGDPFDYHGIQKIRIHGLSRGRAKLQVLTNGMETDYIADYSAPQYIDLPNTPTNIDEVFVPMTNYADAANRGLSIQMKFEGRNTDITQPEPAHVIQVLAIQSSPQGTGKRAN